ncbi:MAG: glycosyltransferase, partial [Balneolaceae bacterium]
EPELVDTDAADEPDDTPDRPQETGDQPDETKGQPDETEGQPDETEGQPDETEEDLSSFISFEEEPQERGADSAGRRETIPSGEEDSDEDDGDEAAKDDDKKEDDDDGFFIDLSDTEPQPSETPGGEPVQKDSERIQQESDSSQPEGEPPASDEEEEEKTAVAVDETAGAPPVAGDTREGEQIKSSSAFGDEVRRQPQLTIIIPTATVQRPVLEDCLTSVFRQTSADRTRIIVIDNGSVDDTATFLRRLMREHPRLTVLRNEQNLGFAGAVNQGLIKAGDGFVVVMHNDVMLRNPVPSRLAHKLEKNPDIGLIVPRTEQNTWNPAQCDDHTDDRPFADTDIVDGYMMVFRNQPGLAMSREYGLAYFDDADFCYRMQRKGYRIAIDNREQVVHLGGKTTGDLGLSRFTKGYWRNAALFHKEWDIAPRFPSDQARTDALRQFVVLGGLINPFYPEEHLLAHFNNLFTSEQKTRVQKTEFPPDALKAMIRLMMAANQRDVLRKLEEQLDPLPPDRQLYYDLVTFYFDRTIYSRCKRYLDKLSGSELPVALELYHLKIALGEKDYARAAELLTDMVGRYPTHPEVLITAAEIHRKNGNREQSEKFTALARTFDPSARA